MRTINGFELPRVLTPVQAERLGITRGQARTELRRANWQRLAPGIILTRPDDPTRADWAEVGVALGGPDSAVTGWDAVRVSGLGDASPPGRPVVVLTTAGMNRVVGSVRLRRTDRPFAATVTSAHSTVLPLVPVVTTARAVTDAALEYRDAGRVRALVTSAIQRRACPVEELLAELRAGPRQHSRLLRLALRDAADGARSAAEAAAVTKLRRAAVPAFELNVAVIDRFGRLIYVVDVLWRELRAVLEIDSREFHFTEQAWQATMRRHNELSRFGLAVAHYPPSAVRRRGWAGEVTDWLRARAAEIGVHYLTSGGVISPPPGGYPTALVVAGRTRR